MLAALLVSSSAAWESPPSEIRSLRDIGEGLVRRVASYSGDNPGAPGTVGSWETAATGRPLLVGAYSGSDPDYALIPVTDHSGRWVGCIGVGIETGAWLWYAEAESPRLPPPTVEEVSALLHRQGHVPRSRHLDPHLIIATDRRLYWHFSWDGPSADHREIFVDLWDSSRVFTEKESLQQTALHPALPPPSRPSTQGRPAQFIGPEPAPSPEDHDLDVPHYYQETGFHCGPASLQMVFDYWGEEIIQENIGYVGNTSPTWGTNPSDLLRAAHFSHLSDAVANPFLVGYPERVLGYTAAENNWSHDPDYARRYEDLKELVSGGYPVLIATWYSPSHTVGHYRVVKGYSDPLDIFIVHDPWYGGPYMGPNVHFRQQLLVDNLWKLGMLGRWGLLACPWDLKITVPDSAETRTEFTVQTSVAYPGPRPFSGEEQVMSPAGTLELGPGLVLAEGETATKPLPGITTTGTADTVSWRVVAKRGVEGAVAMTVTAKGLVTDTAQSYREYTDEIGGVQSDTIRILPGAPVMLAGFEAQPEPGTVTFVWWMDGEMDPEDLRLTAQYGTKEWRVPVEMISETEFAACDESQELIPGGDLTYLLHCRRMDGHWDLLHREEITLEPVITVTSLLGIHPNPARDEVSVSFGVHQRQRVRIALYDATGRLISRLADRPYDIGFHSVSWDGFDGGGRRVADGIYFLRMDGASSKTTRKVVWFQ
jgi:hypothetical protein